MPIKELKCIEILIRFLTRKSRLKDEISAEFEDSSIFEETKTNLFNLISINDLIENFNLNQQFSLKLFLEQGIIPGLYDEKTFIPEEDLRYSNDYRTFYTYLIEALKEGNYLFDESNNIFVSSEKLETTVPQVWLYRLSQAVKRNKYERMYFYNKNKENHITDKNDLLAYMQHTKTFLVELNSSNPNADYKIEFASAEAKTNNIIKYKNEKKVDDIIETFKEQISSEYQVAISKYKLSDAFFIISKAEQLGRKFYGETLETQQKYLNSWMLEFINCNKKANQEAQKYSLIASTTNIHGYDLKDINEQYAIIGLINLYFGLFESLGLDLETVSLADFKIDDYISESHKENLITLNSLIKDINSHNNVKQQIYNRIEKVNSEIATLDQLKEKEELSRKKSERESLIKLLSSQEALEEELNTKRNILQEKVRIAKQNSIENIAFDNDLIIKLLIKCTKEGRVYFKKGTNQIIFELYGNDIGRVLFKASINIEKMILFIENNNYKIDDLSHNKWM